MAEHANKEVVMAALASLLDQKALRAISISGDWGVGKTHLVRQFARENAQAFADAKLKFVYVSLFGLTSLEAVRSRIAASSLSKAQRIVARIPLVAQTGLIDMAKVGEIARSVAEQALLKNLFVVVDDLERLGAGVEAGDVVGLISELIEQFGCKVVLVLNKAKLAAQINQFEEKVFDLTLHYRPEAATVVPYGLPREDDCRIAIPVFEQMGCANIRIAKRLSWILRKLGETTCLGAAKIWPTIVRQATILVILKYDHGFDRAQLEQVIARTETAHFLKELNKELGEKEAGGLPAGITALLDKIEHTDAGFGACIVDLLEQGALDHPKLAAALQHCAETEQHVAQTAQLRGFFQQMNGGFTVSGPEFAASITAFLNEQLVRPERFDLFHLCNLLIQIDPREESQQLAAERLAYVVRSIKPENRAKHLKQFTHLWAAGVFDRLPYVEQVTTYALADCFDVSEWEPESAPGKAAALAAFTEQQLVDFLLGLREPKSMQLLRNFRQRLKDGAGFPTASLPELRARFDGALKAIAARDVLFRAKIEEYSDPDRKAGPF